MQDIRNYIAAFIIGSSVLIFFYFFLLTRREIKLEKKFNNFALSTTKETKTILDGISSLAIKVLSAFSKITKKIKFFNNQSKKYEKYLILNDSTMTSLDIVTLKNIFFTFCFTITFVLEVLGIININYISVVIISYLIYLLPDFILNIKYENRKRTISKDIIDTIILINNNLKKGKNLIKAIDEIAKEVEKELAYELEKIKFDLENGLSLSLAFKHFDNRMEMKETSYISDTITSLEELSFTSLEIFDYLARKLKEKQEDSERLVTYSGGARIFYKISASLPVVLTILIIVFKPSYFEAVLKNTEALLLFISIILLYISYLILIKRIERGE